MTDHWVLFIIIYAMIKKKRQPMLVSYNIIVYVNKYNNFTNVSFIISYNNL